MQTDADTDGPRAALERLLALNAAATLDSEEGRALLGGELDEVDGASLGELSPPDRLVMLTDGTAVARIPAKGEERPDFYFYLRPRPDGRWEIHAFRTLALMGLPRQLRQMLRELPSRTPEMEEMLPNLDLTLSSDEALRDWFAANRSKLERLRALARAGGETLVGDRGRRVRNAGVDALLRELHAAMLSVTDEGVTLVTIGGMVDNEVGFLHADDPARVPPIGDDEFIWIEPLGGGWYLFRTT